jgi:hypothetical protein
MLEFRACVRVSDCGFSVFEHAIDEAGQAVGDSRAIFSNYPMTISSREPGPWNPLPNWSKHRPTF